MPTLALAANLSLHYQDANPAGSETVLLLHGLGADSTSWQLQVPALVEAGYRVLVPDLRGFGRSSYPGHSTIPDMARDVAGLLQQLEIDAVQTVGLSMGGTVALQLALDHAALVQGLVLVNTTARLRPYRLDGWLSYGVRYIALWGMGYHAQARLVARRTFPQAHQEELRQAFCAQILRAHPPAYRAALRALGCFNVQPRLGEIRVPTLVVTGAHDATIAPALQQLLVDGIHEARQIVVADGGHAVSADQPAAFNRLLVEFLQSAAAPVS